MKIGNIEIDKPLALAPMEDVTDAPFRIICKQLGADIVYTEFANCEALIRDVTKAFEKITVHEEERPVAIQLYGGREESMEDAARIAESFKPDFIDINCGCWVKNVVARNEGAGLLRDLSKFKRIVSAVIRGTSLPVTVKTRLGWDMDSVCILDVARMVEDLGAKALTVHCRVRSQGHKGDADWSWLEKIKKVISIPLIGNGDIVVDEDAKRMFETGCDGVMIGRGAIANPWIFAQIKHYLKTSEHLEEPSVEERVRICLNHLKASIDPENPMRGIYRFRKFYGGYFKGVAYTSDVRKDLMSIMTFEEIEKRLNQFVDEQSIHT